MTTSAASRFIEALAADHALRERLRARGRGIHLEDVVILAAEAGYDFTASELRQAFARDWHMRRRFFSTAVVPATSRSSDSAPEDSAPKDPTPTDSAPIGESRGRVSGVESPE